MPPSSLTADEPPARPTPAAQKQPGRPKQPKQPRRFLPLVSLLTTLVSALVGGGFLMVRADASPPPIPVTVLVQDVPQYLPAGYDSQEQFEEWNGYTCGPATMTAILRAYGAKTRIGIIFDLMYYQQFGIQDVDKQGLHGPDGFVTLLHKYYPNWYAVSYDGRDGGYLSYDHLQRIVEAGYPVAADFRNDGSYWPNLSKGHWMTVVGFTDTKVIVRDSSRYQLDDKLSIDLFKRLYTGLAAPVLPVGVPLP